MNKFYLPVMQKIIIQNYSLYECPLQIDFSSKLNIIYGTNGTGKSTLLMIILFSIVGPYRGGIKTKVRQEQRRDNRPIYEESFFSDRMAKHNDEPIVTAMFSINNDEYCVKHSLLDGKLLSAEVNMQKLPGKIISYRTYENKYTKQRSDEIDLSDLKDYLIYSYQENLKKSTGLPGGVNTLISMLLDVMFFDEGRKLTFWNTDLQETIIGKYIVESDFYERYCERKLTTKALESAYKKKSEILNYMNQFFKREKSEGEVGYNQKDEKLQAELIELENFVVKQEDILEKEQKLYSRKNVNFLAVARKEETIKEEINSLENLWYSNLFPSQYKKYYNKFSKLMEEGICPVCENRHSFSFASQNCIICGEKLVLSDSPDLSRIDLERKKHYSLLTDVKKELSQINTELSALRIRIERIRKDINKKNVRMNEIRALLTTDEVFTENSDKKRLEKARAERDEALLKFKDSKRSEDNMKKIIEDSFEDNFMSFRSSFINFSSSFFGENHEEDLSLPFNEETLTTPLMKFELDGKARDEEYMLSESQRIFTDLSFRFSVLTSFHGKSFFICETPDSTLDIFHEDKAASTFLEYIKLGNSLILTANARHSNLIYKLYKSFNKDDITVVDLTQVSKLALANNFSFASYIKER